MKTLIFTLLAFAPLLSYGQAEELKQRTALFLEEQAANYKIKELNGNEPDYGVLQETQFIHHSYFQLKQIEKDNNVTTLWNQS